MTAREVAAAHARQRSRLATALRRQGRAAWSKVHRDGITETWLAQVPRLLAALNVGQYAAAETAEVYVAAVLAEQGVTGGPAGLVDPARFAGIASDGRDLESLLQLPAIIAKTAIGQGYSVDRAMAAGGALVQLVAHTQVTDAGRTADQAALVSRRHVGGYVRMAVGKTCARCLILAGRRYRWNAGFDRHEHCDCIGIPAAEDTADDLTTDPKRAFAAMDTAEQDRVFGKAGAQAIRDGADMGQVVNARRGMSTASVFGHDVLITTEGATTRGVAGRRLGARPPRLMPEQIYLAAAGNRDEAIRLLRRFGFLL